MASITRRIIPCTFLVGLSACSPADRREAPQDVVFDTLGDTIVARVASEGRWGPGSTLVADLVIGGSDDDPDAIFGGLRDLMAPTPEGGVVVVPPRWRLWGRA